MIMPGRYSVCEELSAFWKHCLVFCRTIQALLQVLRAYSWNEKAFKVEAMLPEGQLSSSLGLQVAPESDKSSSAGIWAIGAKPPFLMSPLMCMTNFRSLPAKCTSP